MATFISYMHRKLIEELMMKKLVIMVIGVSFLLMSNAYAEYGGHYDDYDDRFHQRQEHQSRRIEYGARNGDLTHREIEKLRCEQEEIARLEHRYLRDGWFSNREQRKLQRKQNKASRRIRNYKNNGRVNRRYYRDNHEYGASGIHIGSNNGGFHFSW
jgi:hypothetical protein